VQVPADLDVPSSGGSGRNSTLPIGRPGCCSSSTAQTPYVGSSVGWDHRSILILISAGSIGAPIHSATSGREYTS